jgi:ferredoxin--NADP+ reductase
MCDEAIRLMTYGAHAKMNVQTKLLPDSATVLSVKHWTDRLFSFQVERAASFRFRSGEFVMIGLMGDPDPKTGKQKPILRAYSIASPSWDETLEFYSIKVPDGPLTSRLQRIETGDQIILRPKPVGTLVLDALLPAKRLWLCATGTGIAPFASLIREPESFERFDEVILMHTCRDVAELAYGEELVEHVRSDEVLSEIECGKLRYLPATTREQSKRMGRITDALSSGSAFEELGFAGDLNPDTDRIMICGSQSFNKDMMDLLKKRGFSEGANSDPGDFVVEKAFVG